MDQAKKQNQSSQSTDNSTPNSINHQKEKENFTVNKKGFIEMTGEVIELLPAATFKVKLDNGQEIHAHLSGKMRMNRILLLVGDKVKVEISPYDLTKGRVSYRY